jgi:hypothetical protein
VRLFLIGLALVIAPATVGQAKDGNEKVTKSTPSADALELVRLLKLFPSTEQISLGHYEKSIGKTGIFNLAIKPSCDPDDDRCSNIAAEIGEKMLRDRIAFDNKLMEYISAQHFQRSLTEEQVKKSISILTDPDILMIISAIVNRPNIIPPIDIRKSIENGGMVGRWDYMIYRQEFDERTKDLPRAKASQISPILPSIPPAPTRP